MARRVIFSDIHFGDPTCSLQDKRVRDGLRKVLRDIGSVEEIIFAGDILDANVSTFTQAIFGGRDGIGLKSWLRHIFEGGRFEAGRIVYVPGNHDYSVWDFLCTDRYFLGPIAAGRRPDPAKTPKREGFYDETFLNGVLPATFRGTLRVSFPDYEFSIGGRRALVTHGYYMDEKQTLGKNIRKMLKDKKYKNNHERGRRAFFGYSATYQALAHAVSYTKWTRHTTHKIHIGISGIKNMFMGSWRNKPIDSGRLGAIEDYLKDYRQREPDIFIFGHTHKPAHCKTSDFKRTAKKRRLKKVIDVWNTGAFVKRGKKDSGSFILVDDSLPKDGQIELIRFDGEGKRR